MEAISVLLDHKLSKLHEDLSSFKAVVRGELKAMGLRVTAMEGKLHVTDTKLQELEQELKNLKMKGSPQPGIPGASKTDRNTSAIVGNIPTSQNFEKAKEWVLNECTEANLPKPEVYFKTTYKGPLFAKFTNVVDREKFVNTIMTKYPRSKTAPYAKEDLPIDARTIESTLWGLKKMLGESRGINKACIDVDIDKSTLSVATKLDPQGQGA